MAHNGEFDPEAGSEFLSFVAPTPAFDSPAQHLRFVGNSSSSSSDLSFAAFPFDAVFPSADMPSASSFLHFPVSVTPTVHSSLTSSSVPSMIPQSHVSAPSSPKAAPSAAPSAPPRPSNKRPPPEDVSELDPKADKRLKRMEKNRENSRESRKRQKLYVSGLEEKIAKLESDNAFLRMQLQQNSTAQLSWMEKEEAEKKAGFRILQELARDPQKLNEMHDGVEKIVEKFASYGPERKSAIVYHFEQLRQLFDPSPQEKLLLWALQQNDAFFEDNGKSPGMFSLLSKELEITEEQKGRLKKRRNSVRSLMTELSASYAVMNDLNRRMSVHLAALRAEVETVRRVFSPIQQAKFFALIESNEPIVHMVNSVWNLTRSNYVNAIEQAASVGTPAAPSPVSAPSSSSAVPAAPSTSLPFGIPLSVQAPSSASAAAAVASAYLASVTSMSSSSIPPSS